jgi:hypothetical protein
MSSSTSSFRAELKVLAVVAAVLLSCEAAIRLGERWLSKDLDHISQIPAISQQLSQGAGVRLLFLGNSLTRKGIDPQVLTPILERQWKTTIQAERVFPGATAIPEWYYAFKHYFVDRGRLPDVLVLSFAEGMLQDDQLLRPALIAHFYSDVSDAPLIFAQDIPEFGDRVEFLLSEVSASFVNRNRVEARVLKGLIPHYQETAEQINGSLNARRAEQRSQMRPAYHRLERLLQLARDHRVQVILVAMPVQAPYLLDPQIVTVAQAAGATLVDCRAVPGLGQERYEDSMHMNAAGAAIFSEALARQLAQRPYTRAAPLSEARAR